MDTNDKLIEALKKITVTNHEVDKSIVNLIELMLIQINQLSTTVELLSNRTDMLLQLYHARFAEDKIN